MKQTLLLITATVFSTISWSQSRYSIAVSSGIASFGSYDAGQLVFYRGNAGILALNYHPKVAISMAGYMEWLSKGKNTISAGLVSHVSGLKLESQVFSSNFEDVWGRSNLWFGYAGPAMVLRHRIKETKWKWEAGLDVMYRLGWKLSNPEFDSLGYLGVAQSPPARVMGYWSFGISRSFKKNELGITYGASINPLIQYGLYLPNRMTFLGLKARFYLGKAPVKQLIR